MNQIRDKGHVTNVLYDRNVDLSRGEQEPPDGITTVIVGNGATINGWKPFDEVIEELTPNGNIRGSADQIRRIAKQKCGYLSLLSFKGRTARAELYLNLKKNSGFNSWNQVIPQACMDLVNVRKELSQKFLDYEKQGHISTSYDLFSSEHFSKNDYFITTNWDSLLWKDRNVKNLIQLHGMCGYPDSLTLPTEIIIDEFPFQEFSNSSWIKQFQNLPTSVQTDFAEVFKLRFGNQLAKMHDLSNKWIAKSKRIVIFGSALNTYDAELLAQLGTHTNRNGDTQLIVINHDKNAFYKAIAITGIDQLNAKFIGKWDLKRYSLYKTLKELKIKSPL